MQKCFGDMPLKRSKNRLHFTWLKPMINRQSSGAVRTPLACWSLGGQALHVWHGSGVKPVMNVSRADVWRFGVHMCMRVVVFARVTSFSQEESKLMLVITRCQTTSSPLASCFLQSRRMSSLPWRLRQVAWPLLAPNPWQSTTRAPQADARLLS
jgi:hypothetical protein